MTEEQNKLAERLDQLRNQLVMNRGLHIDDHQSFCAHLGEIIAALREPATDAVLNDVIDRLGEEYAGEDFAGDTDAWNMTVGHCIEVVRAALKGKGASQGADDHCQHERAKRLRLSDRGSGAHRALPPGGRAECWCCGEFVQEIVLFRSFNICKTCWRESEPPIAESPEPSGEFVRVPRALLLHIQTRVSDIHTQLAIHNLLVASPDEQKG